MPQISLNLMKKRRRRIQFRLRRRRYIHPCDVQDDSPSPEVAGEDVSQQTRATVNDDTISRQEVEALRRGYEAKLREASERVSKAESTAASLTRELDSLRESLQKAEDRFDVARKTVEDSRAQVLRARSDMESQRKRIQRERDDLKELAGEDLLRQLLPIVDNMAIALKSCTGEMDAAKVTQGLTMIQRELRSIMEGNGLKQISAVGEPFDPRIHDAASTARDTDKPDGIILEELRPGYVFKTKVLRPTMVVVNKLHDTPVTSSSEHSSGVEGDGSGAGNHPTTPTPSTTIDGKAITPRSLRSITGKPVAPPPVRPQAGDDQSGGSMDKTPFKNVTDLSDTQF